MSATDDQSDDLSPELAESDVRMTIWEHLGELRVRLSRAALGLLMGGIVCWVFRVEILALLVKPYEKEWIARGMPGTPELQTLSPSDVFVGYMQLSIVGGIVLASPMIFYQLWAFISPGLYAREKRLIVPFVLFSSTLFIGGVLFAYYVAFPFSFGYFFSLLGQVTSSGTVLTQRPTLESYLDFTTRMLLAFGAVFELPIFLGFLALGGIVTPRQLLKFGRWAVVAAFVVSAIVTPPEVMSQIAVAVTLSILYYLSVLIAFIIAPKRKDDDEAAEEKKSAKKKAKSKRSEKRAKPAKRKSKKAPNDASEDD